MAIVDPRTAPVVQAGFPGPAEGRRALRTDAEYQRLEAGTSEIAGQMRERACDALCDAGKACCLRNSPLPGFGGGGLGMRGRSLRATSRCGDSAKTQSTPCPQ